MAEQLSQDVWALILQHVPQADRLKHCALVCTKLSKAAAAATVALEVSLFRDSDSDRDSDSGSNSDNGQEQGQQLAEALDSYLQHHGSHVTSLVLDSGWQPLARLPCPQLLHLVIHSASPVQLGPHGSLPGVLDSCTGLTSLRLSDCIVPTVGGLSSLSVLVDLRRLQIEDMEQPGGGSASFPGSTLACLTHLTRLDVSAMCGIDDVHHVSSLTKLSVLRIEPAQGPVRLAPDIAPGFALPASLQQLCLGDCVVLDAPVLAAATQLTTVELCGCTVEQPGGAALLTTVAGLQHLVTLDLSDLRDMHWPAPSAPYAALTASSRLQKLVVRDCGLPEGVWQHVFPAARCYPAMRVCCMHLSYWRDAEAVSSLVRCCPGLQDLQLCVDCTDDQAGVGESAEHIAALTNLQQLELHVTTGGAGGADAARAAAALLPLTALKGLAWCDIKLGEDLFDDQGKEVLLSCYAKNTADPGQPPDVWLQLLEQCLTASNSQPAAVAIAVQQARRLEQQEQRLAELERQNAALQQQGPQLQALQAQVQQQGPQLQALQAQVQQLLVAATTTTAAACVGL